MSPLKLILQSLTYHWRINLAVALGVAAATAVLTGALLVGDSVRGSLRALTLDRLGRVDEVLVSDRFFGRELVDRLAASDRFQQHYARAVAAILFPHATVERQGGERAARASGVLVVASGADFWELGESVRPRVLPGAEEIVINQAVADDWGARIGDQVVLRLPKATEVPADSPLARKTGRVQGIPRLTIVDIIPAEGLGRFSLRASQSLPRNVYVATETVQDALDQEGQVNAILVSGPASAEPPGEEAGRALQAALRPALQDYGFSIQRIRRTFAPDEGGVEEMVYDYYSVTTDRMIFSPAAEAAAQRAFAPHQGQGVLTYLANAIQKVDEQPGDGRDEISYSTITAIDLSPHFDLRSTSGAPIERLVDDAVVLNSWAASDLGAEPGDAVRVVYFEPETTHGQATESSATFQIKAVTPLAEPAEPYRRRREAVFQESPTLANDPHLTPEVEGVTDQESIENWDPPFPFDYDRVRGQDDVYWENHRTTPKAFISLAAGQRLWGSRFGQLTSFRIPAEGVTRQMLEQAFVGELEQEKAALGFVFTAVKRRQLEASRGTTPFDGLFLGLSLFIIAAALMLVALLFRLGVEQRAAELGILLAVGLRRRRAAWLLIAEGALVAAAGGILGVLVGVGYARLMLAGLRTWWVGAITTPFLEYYSTSLSLVGGCLLGVFVSLLTIALSVWQMRRISVRRLLAGQAGDAGSFAPRPQRVLSVIAGLLVLAALVLSAAATTLSGMGQAGAFVGAGALLLTGLLLGVWGTLRRGGQRAGGGLLRQGALFRLALRNGSRNPSRSATTIALMATASFLIVAMSSFRLPPTASGAGGFDLLAETSEPLFVDLNSAEDREDLLADDAQLLAGSDIFGLRLRAGDDASCNNLYRPGQPRVIGVTPEFVEYFEAGDAGDRAGARRGFSWAVMSAADDQQRDNPWRLLEAEQEDDAIPVVIDMNTAMYSLGLPPTPGSVYEAVYDGRSLRFRVVGLLENSVLQGSLLISENSFQRSFPEISGYRYFLIRSPQGRSQQVAQLLEDRLGDEGFDAVSAAAVLEQLLAVQNTYLSTFQSLGALGLLLGTFGLATVQMRSVLERRGELALMRAAGYRRRRLAAMVLLESLLLLFGGLATGVLAALLAVLPHKLLGDASIPASLLRDLAVMLAVVFVVGVISSLTTVRAALRIPLLAALRGD